MFHRQPHPNVDIETHIAMGEETTFSIHLDLGTYLTWAEKDMIVTSGILPATVMNRLKEAILDNVKRGT